MSSTNSSSPKSEIMDEVSLEIEYEDTSTKRRKLLSQIQTFYR